VRSGRGHLGIVSAGLVLALVAVSATGCKGGANSAAADTKALSAKTKSTSGSAGSSRSTGPVLPAVAPSSTLQPPSYEGFEPLPIFVYHHVNTKVNNEITIKPATFEAELKMLSDLGYHAITARELVEYHQKGTPLPDKPVMITFDDGWRTQYSKAWPLLRKYGFKATFFINPQPVSQAYKAYMNRDMVVELAKAGNDIESHTWKHSRLTRKREQTAAQFQKETLSALTNANSWIRKVVGQQPVAIAYPYGVYDLETIGFVSAAGYKVGFTVDESVSDARKWDRYQLRRFTIGSGETSVSFKRRLLSGPLEVRNITPAPGSRIVGLDADVSVDISDVPSSTSDIMLRSGPSMKRAQIVERNGRRYAVAQLRRCKAGFRVVSMSAKDAQGRKFYASWSLVMGDRAK
jgi:peptidoglycan/xylan/chitin deacetylase (PgdA/CDA1 family)